MKAKNLLMTFIAVLALSWTSALFAAGPSAHQAAMTPTTVNINVADAKTLSTVLKGVGLARAQAIVSYRKKNGKFYSAEELTAIKGIGDGTIARNKGKIVVK